MLSIETSSLLFTSTAFFCRPITTTCPRPLIQAFGPAIRPEMRAEVRRYRQNQKMFLRHCLLYRLSAGYRKFSKNLQLFTALRYPYLPCMLCPQMRPWIIKQSRYRNQLCLSLRIKKCVFAIDFLCFFNDLEEPIIFVVLLKIS